MSPRGVCAALALLAAGCLQQVRYPGLMDGRSLTDCNYQLCETGETASGICVVDNDRGQACFIDGENYEWGSAGWLRYMRRSCELRAERQRWAGCGAIAGWALTWDHAPPASVFMPGDRERTTEISRAELIATRDLLTGACEKLDNSDDDDLGQSCMVAAMLHNQLEPRSPKKRVMKLLNLACRQVHHMEACYFLARGLFAEIDLPGVQAGQERRAEARDQRAADDAEWRHAQQQAHDQAHDQQMQSLGQAASDALAQSQRSVQPAQDAERRILADGAERQRLDAERRTNDAAARRVDAQREQDRVRQLQERQRDRAAEVRREDAQREEARRSANADRLARDQKAEADRLAREQRLAEERAAKERKLADERAERARKQREQQEDAERSRRATQEEERRRRDDEKQRKENEQKVRDAERKRRVGAFIPDESFDMSPSGYYAKLGVRVTWSYTAGGSSICLDSSKETSYRVSLQLSNQGQQRVRVMIRGTRVYMTPGFPGETSGPSGTRVLDPGAANEISGDTGCAEGRPRGVGVSANFAPQD